MDFILYKYIFIILENIKLRILYLVIVDIIIENSIMIFMLDKCI